MNMQKWIFRFLVIGKYTATLITLVNFNNNSYKSLPAQEIPPYTIEPHYKKTHHRIQFNVISHGRWFCQVYLIANFLFTILNQIMWYIPITSSKVLHGLPLYPTRISVHFFTQRSLPIL